MKIAAWFRKISQPFNPPLTDLGPLTDSERASFLKANEAVEAFNRGLDELLPTCREAAESLRQFGIEYEELEKNNPQTNGVNYETD